MPTFISLSQLLDWVNHAKPSGPCCMLQRVKPGCCLIWFRQGPMELFPQRMVAK